MKSWHNGLGVLIPLTVLAFLILLRFDALTAILRRLRLSWQIRSPKTARSNPQLASGLYAELLRVLARRGMGPRRKPTPPELAAAGKGCEMTPRADEAEILVDNTCSFIEAAQKEAVDAILEMAEHKKFGAAKKLIVAGCLVERFRAQILEQVPEVDAVVGTGEIERIIEAVEGDLCVLPALPPAFLYHDLTPRIVTTPKHAAYIKIAEGCDHPCTFCIIPQLRGAFRSRRFESVVREAENLANAGAREITLIAPDTTSYGEDFGL